MTRPLLTVALVCVALAAGLRGQPEAPPPVDPVHAAFDGILDIYVRDGLVYYNALRQERARSSLRPVAGRARHPGLVDDRQRLAFWINAYNAFVLRTVIDHYLIRGRAAAYPANSIRQCPAPSRSGVPGRRADGDAGSDREGHHRPDGRRAGAAGARPRRARQPAPAQRGLHGGPPRRAARGAARRSSIAASWCTSRAGNTLSVTPLFSWREAAFVAGFAGRAEARYAARSPLEQAVLGLIGPHVVRSEATPEQNRFTMAFTSSTGGSTTSPVADAMARPAV